MRLSYISLLITWFWRLILFGGGLPKVGLPPPWGGTYKGARQGPLNGSNPIQDAACLCNTNEQTFLNFGLHCNSKCFDHNSESITKIKTEILESGHKSGIGLTTMISGSQNTKNFWNRPTGSRLMNFQRFKFFFFKFVVVVSFVRSLLFFHHLTPYLVYYVSPYYLPTPWGS